jgi:hypothetical protein
VSELPPEEPYQLPGTTPALEPDTIEDHPMRASDAEALLAKVIA